MYGNYLRIFRKISEFFFISEVRTIEPKISEIPELKANGTEILGENFSRIGHIPRGCPLFRKFEKILFHSPLKISRMESASGVPLQPTNLTWAAKCLSSDCHHLFPAKITLGRTCNPRVETFCTNFWNYLNTFHWTLNPGLLTSLFCFLFSFLLGHCRLKTGQRRAMENFTTVTHTLFFMAKRIQTQMFVYSLVINYYLFIGAGIWVIFNTTSCAAKTAEKIPCKESHGEKYRAIEQKYSTIQDRVVRK